MYYYYIISYHIHKINKIRKKIEERERENLIIQSCIIIIIPKMMEFDSQERLNYLISHNLEFPFLLSCWKSRSNQVLFVWLLLLLLLILFVIVTKHNKQQQQKWTAKQLESKKKKKKCMCIYSYVYLVSRNQEQIVLICVVDDAAVVKILFLIYMFYYGAVTVIEQPTK